MARLVLLGALLLASGSAYAAELPSRHNDTRPKPAARKCEIDGDAGVPIPGGGCMHIGGYVSVGVNAGTLKSH